ncbi:hypothetical protein [Brevibacillus fulvus]|uniref:Uncharacterized protein n=1 Tax=Brevibacillus fulvus TaxID=1125967 RepID=A0A938Y207_9BACL|nr:hypothetical protein [Brevibacillus fulvus]MBM7591860.1 hypothetical protein [Brevibacillus fulvus]
MNKLDLWNDFCSRFSILDNAVPLFDTEGLTVNIVNKGSNGRNVLKRSERMKSLIINEVNKIEADYKNGTQLYEGLIYIMFWKEGDNVIPLYIGKTEKYGKANKNISANLKNIQNEAFFARWGYNYSYHLGDLSAVVCFGHPEEKQTKKYKKWASMMFNEFPSDKPQLKKEVYFWTTAWKTGDVGVWKEFGATSLTFLEYLLIGLASDIFPDFLLNTEGVNR